MAEKEFNEKIQKGNIFIKKEAFRNMLTHVLRFGSDALEQSIEVMGICVGKYDNVEDKVIVENAVPLIHGDKAEIGFNKDTYSLFKEIGKKYSSDLIGYYHSHPSWGLYLSESDINNLQYFQGETFPYGFGIVFDHTLMGKNGNLGFEIYRLDDYSKAEKYHTIPFEIELPASLEYFKWVQKFSEDFHKKDPILIKELNEFVEPPPGELQEIPTSEDTIVSDDEIKEYLHMDSIISGFQQGTEIFSQEVTDMIKTQMGDWINGMNQGTSRGTEYISKALSKMKEAISSGLIKVDNWFKKTLNETVNEFKKSISKYVDSRVEVNRDLKEHISSSKDKLIEEIKAIIDNNFGDINNELETLGNSMSEKIQESTQMILHIEELVNNYKTNITATNDQVNSLAEDIEKKIETSLTPLQNNIDEKIVKLSTELQHFKDYNSEIKIMFEKLQKIITGFRNLS